MSNDAKIFSELEKLAATIPSPLLWTDKDSIILGCNDLVFHQISAANKEQLIGKAPYEYLPKDVADIVIKHVNQVIQEKRTIIFEESVKDIATGEIKYLLMARAPLFADNGIDVVGMIVSGIDITDRKEKERLQIENEKQKEIIKISDQVSHDIRSPARTIYAMVENNAAKIPEEIRIPLRQTAADIIDVASSLISRYSKGNTAGSEETKPIIASLYLMQIFGEKRIQNIGTAINFTDDYSHDSKLVFIDVQPSGFKRMISNLLNNAVEALAGKGGIVHLSLSIDAIKKDVKITIQDNGKGMTEETASKIKNGTLVATDKKEGHGIGLGQIRETLERNRGKFDIASKLGEGTKVILTFPMVMPPVWLAKDIKINKGDTVVILDDDAGTHAIWNMYFEKYKNDVQLKHFIIGKEAIDFINNFPEKNKLYLLTDQELMKQGDLTGIDVIKQTKLERATLVTSHYDEVAVQQLAAEVGVKILPKDLASDVAMEICEANEKCSKIETAEKVGVVIVDDSEMFANTVARVFKKADKYYNPENFLANTYKYDKDTIMLIDHEFAGNKLNGFDVLKQLHEQGFTKLYLLSGREFAADEIPGYLSVILKTNIDDIMKLATS